MNKPDSHVTKGTIGGALSLLLIAVLSESGIEVGAEVASSITVVVTFIVTYFTKKPTQEQQTILALQKEMDEAMNDM